MSQARRKVLLVEDNPADARLFHELLSAPGEDTFDVTQVSRLDEGLRHLDSEQVDVVVLDVSLPDSSGLETVRMAAAHAARHSTPVVVLTGQSFAHQGVEAVQLGAQDYLIKGKLDDLLLSRSLRYAIERQQLLNALEQERERRQQAEELAQLERLSEPSTAQTTARSFGIVTIQESAPETFAGLVDDYRTLIEETIEEHALKVDRRVSGKIHDLAQDLGVLGATPRDVTEIHVAAIKQCKSDANVRRATTITEEGRMILIEVLGNLASYYRAFFKPAGDRGSGVSSTREAS